MVNYNTKTIELNGKLEDIRRVEVWYRTPFGLIVGLEEAVKILTDAGLEPNLCIVPVPVFIGDTIYEPK